MANNTQHNFIFQTTPDTDQLGLLLPESLLRQQLMSDTSEAIVCFTQQGFSNKLQAYLINYVMSVSSYYPLYA